MSTTFAVLMRALLDAYQGSKTEFAREAEIAPSVLSRLLSGGVPPPTDVCLRIARAGGASASLVLRTAGHGHTADLLETLYGEARVAAQTGTAEDRAFLREFQLLDPRTRKAVMVLIRYNHELSETIHGADEGSRPLARRRRRAVPPDPDAVKPSTEKQTA